MDSGFAGQECIGLVVDGKFPLRRWLGAGERTSVYETELSGAESGPAAIKLVLAEGFDVQARLALWAAARDLSHPHLIRVLHAGYWELVGQPLLYVVTEYADQVLGEILADRPLESEEAVQMLDPVLDTLSFLHTLGLVHGHLKPTNILAVGDSLKLSADGLCRAGQPEGRLAAGGVYEAPESVVGSLQPAADLWALGVTLTEALTQKQPEWGGENQAELRLPVAVPEPFATIARQCLVWDPAARPSLDEIRARLAAPSPEPAAEPQPAVEPEPVAVPKPVVAPAPSQPQEPVAAPPLPPVAPRRIQPQPQRPAPPSSSTAALRRLAMAALLIGLFVIAAWQMKTRRSAPAGSLPGESASADQAAVPAGKGVVEHRQMPQVPDFAMHTLHGVLRMGVRVEVDAQGQVSGATLDPAGPSPYFAKFALEAARQWRFRPPVVDGHPAASAWKLEFSFQQSGAEVTPTQVEP
jgi:TonB family protein